MLASQQATTLRRNAHPDGRPLTPKEREQLLKPYLPPPNLSDTLSPTPQSVLKTKKPRSKPMRTFLKTNIHLLVYTLVHLFFSLYIRLRRAYHTTHNRLLSILYYHHRTPELITRDTSRLSRLPTHLSVILTLPPDEPTGLETLVSDLAEIAAWCACAGIPNLSVYERTGVLKKYIPATHRAVSSNLEAYFGPGPRTPSVSVGAPHLPSFSPPVTPPAEEEEEEEGVQGGQGGREGRDKKHLTILLLSAEDGRSTLVDLTKTLAEMAQRGKVAAGDISAELVDAEISESVMGEPDLLVVFGPRVVLEGYPPWQVRLTEIFHVEDNEGVNYQVFIRALHNFAKAQMRFGR